MPDPLEIPRGSILAHFVDRINEVGHFEDVLEGSQHRILAIHGPGGIGKSLLLSRMMDECRERSIKWLHVEWTTSRKYDYLNLMRTVRDRSGSKELFSLFNDRVNWHTKPGYSVEVKLELGDISNVEVLKDGTLSQGGNVINIGHTIKDFHVPILRPDIESDEQGRRAELTHAFFPCLEAALRAAPLVIFLDGLEHAEDEASTIGWIREELLARIRDGALGPLIVVLAGRTEVKVEPDYFQCMRSFELKRFAAPDVEQYLQRRGIHWNSNELSLFVLANSGNGNPDQVARMADSYLLQRERAS